MNKFQDELLKLAYDNLLKTNELHYEILPINGNELVDYTNAAYQLSELGYIDAISDNIVSRSIDITNVDNLSVRYKLTKLGIKYVVDNLK